MSIELYPSYTFSEQGRRQNNEDFVFPPLNKQEEIPLFIVCDGVGGSQKGEIASQLASEALWDFVKNNPYTNEQDYWQNAIAYIENAFDNFFLVHPQSEGMATTLTFIFLSEKGATIGHIGDSRIYYFKNRKIEWRSEDHSLMNDLIKNKVITPIEAKSHPQRNVIIQALQGGRKKSKLDIQEINNLSDDDYFLLCTDGVLEAISDNLLQEIISGDIPDLEKVSQIKSCCEAGSRDNYSGYLIHIKKVVQIDGFIEHDSTYKRYQNELGDFDIESVSNQINNSKDYTIVPPLQEDNSSKGLVRANSFWKIILFLSFFFMIGTISFILLKEPTKTIPIESNIKVKTKTRNLTDSLVKIDAKVKDSSSKEEKEHHSKGTKHSQ